MCRKPRQGTNPDQFTHKYLSFFSLSLLLHTECPPAVDGMERFACPSPDRQGRYRCIDDHVLCDGFIDCPDGEDEERQACMFYKTVSLCSIHAFTHAHKLCNPFDHSTVLSVDCDTLAYSGSPNLAGSVAY